MWLWANYLRCYFPPRFEGPRGQKQRHRGGQSSPIQAIFCVYASWRSHWKISGTTRELCLVAFELRVGLARWAQPCCLCYHAPSTPLHTSLWTRRFAPAHMKEQHSVVGMECYLYNSNFSPFWMWHSTIVSDNLSSSSLIKSLPLRSIHLVAILTPTNNRVRRSPILLELSAMQDLWPVYPTSVNSAHKPVKSRSFLLWWRRFWKPWDRARLRWQIPSLSKQGIAPRLCLELFIALSLWLYCRCHWTGPIDHFNLQRNRWRKEWNTCSSFFDLVPC